MLLCSMWLASTDATPTFVGGRRNEQIGVDEVLSWGVVPAHNVYEGQHPVDLRRSQTRSGFQVRVRL